MPVLSSRRGRHRRNVRATSMSEMPDAAAAAPPSPLAALSKLSLLDDSGRGAFFGCVASQLCSTSPPVVEERLASLHEGFGLDFASGEPAALLLAAKLVICRVASRTYEGASAKAALLADLVAAGLPQAAAEWIREAAQAATLPCAAQLRLAQGHAAAAFSSDYLQDFDWQLNYVLASSTQSGLPLVGTPLVQLQLKVRKAGTDAEAIERLELAPAELDAAISTLGAAVSSLRALPEPGVA